MDGRADGRRFGSAVSYIRNRGPSAAESPQRLMNSDMAVPVLRIPFITLTSGRDVPGSCVQLVR